MYFHEVHEKKMEVPRRQTPLEEVATVTLRLFLLHQRKYCTLRTNYLQNKKKRRRFQQQQLRQWLHLRSRSSSSEGDGGAEDDDNIQ